MNSVYVVICHSDNSSYVSGVFKDGRDAEKHAHEQRSRQGEGNHKGCWWEVAMEPVR